MTTLFEDEIFPTTNLTSRIGKADSKHFSLLVMGESIHLANTCEVTIGRTESPTYLQMTLVDAVEVETGAWYQCAPITSC